MGLSEHSQEAAARTGIRVAVLTASDTRSAVTDGGGALVASLATDAGWWVTERQVVPDDGDRLRLALQALIADRPGSGLPGSLTAGDAASSSRPAKPDVVVVTGGTGFAPRDVTVDALAPLFDRRIDGFGELFRMLSFAEIGSAAMLSRACAGVCNEVAVFLIPGSPAAIRLALERLILPEGPHLVSELRRGRTPAAKGVESDRRPDHHSHGSHHHR